MGADEVHLETEANQADEQLLRLAGQADLHTRCGLRRFWVGGQEELRCRQWRLASAYLTLVVLQELPLPGLPRRLPGYLALVARQVAVELRMRQAAAPVHLLVLRPGFDNGRVRQAPTLELLQPRAGAPGRLVAASTPLRAMVSGAIGTGWPVRSSLERTGSAPSRPAPGSG